MSSCCCASSTLLLSTASCNVPRQGCLAARPELPLNANVVSNVVLLLEQRGGIDRRPALGAPRWHRPSSCSGSTSVASVAVLLCEHRGGIDRPPALGARRHGEVWVEHKSECWGIGLLLVTSAAAARVRLLTKSSIWRSRGAGPCCPARCALKGPTRGPRSAQCEKCDERRCVQRSS